jgi:hypothetical protein
MGVASVVLSAPDGTQKTLTATCNVATEAANFLANPSAFDYPDATNTGYANYVAPELGRKLTSSDLTLDTATSTSSAGQVFYRQHFTNHFKVAHPNVKFLGCWFDFQPTSSSNVYVITDHKTGPSAPASDADIWTMSYCTVTQSPFSLGSMNTTYANVDHCDFSGGTDVWDPFGMGSVEWYFNYCHHLVQNSSTASHCDIFQPVGGAGNVKFHHNTCLSYNPDTGFFGNTSIMQIGQLTGNITGTIDYYDNLCDGGNYMANANWASDTASPPLTLTGTIKIRDNRLGRHAQFGVHTHIPGPNNAPNFVIANNVFDDDNSLAWG